MSDAYIVTIIVLLLVNLAGMLVIGIRVGLLAADDRKQDRRLTQLETRVENLPTHRDLTELRSGIAEVVESVAAINGQTLAMTQMLRTIQEHLLENDR